MKGGAFVIFVTLAMASRSVSGARVLHDKEINDPNQEDNSHTKMESELATANSNPDSRQLRNAGMQPDSKSYRISRRAEDNSTGSRVSGLYRRLFKTK